MQFDNSFREQSSLDLGILTSLKEDHKLVTVSFTTLFVEQPCLNYLKPAELFTNELQYIRNDSSAGKWQ